MMYQLRLKYGAPSASADAGFRAVRPDTGPVPARARGLLPDRARRPGDRGGPARTRAGAGRPRPGGTADPAPGDLDPLPRPARAGTAGAAGGDVRRGRGHRGDHAAARPRVPDRRDHAAGTRAARGTGGRDHRRRRDRRRAGGPDPQRRRAAGAACLAPDRDRRGPRRRRLRLHDRPRLRAGGQPLRLLRGVERRRLGAGRGVRPARGSRTALPGAVHLDDRARRRLRRLAPHRRVPGDRGRLARRGRARRALESLRRHPRHRACWSPTSSSPRP